LSEGSDRFIAWLARGSCFSAGEGHVLGVVEA
jgi:hypothetical protein